MLMRRVSATDKIPNGLLRSAAVAGLASGLVAAGTLGGLGTANASCLSIGGFFSIGSGCTSTPLSFAVVLGNGTANARGLLTGAVAIGNATFADAQGFLTGAIATGLTNTAPGPVPPQTDVRSMGALSLAYGGGTNMLVRTEGNLAFAIAQGGNYIARAGQTPSDIGNVALGLGFGSDTNPVNEEIPLAAVVAGDIAPNGPPSYFNLALNLGDDGNVQAKGFGNSVLNFFGNRNSLFANGFLNNATNILGDDNGLTASNVPESTANILRQIGGNVAFAAFGDGNDLIAGSQIAPPPGGPFSILGALGVNGQTINQPGTGIDIRTPFDTPASSSFTNADFSAARGTQGSVTQGSVVRQLLSFRPGSNAGPKATSSGGSTGGSSFKSVSDQINTSVKKFRETVNNVTRKLTERAKSEPAESKQ